MLLLYLVLPSYYFAGETQELRKKDRKQSSEKKNGKARLEMSCSVEEQATTAVLTVSSLVRALTRALTYNIVHHILQRRVRKRWIFWISFCFFLIDRIQPYATQNKLSAVDRTITDLIARTTTRKERMQEKTGNRD